MHYIVHSFHTASAEGYFLHICIINCSGKLSFLAAFRRVYECFTMFPGCAVFLQLLQIDTNVINYCKKLSSIPLSLIRYSYRKGEFASAAKVSCCVPHVEQVLRSWVRFVKLLMHSSLIVAHPDTVLNVPQLLEEIRICYWIWLFVLAKMYKVLLFPDTMKIYTHPA